jgi:hypothetical protein
MPTSHLAARCPCSISLPEKLSGHVAGGRRCVAASTSCDRSWQSHVSGTVGGWRCDDRPQSVSPSSAGHKGPNSSDARR